MYSPGFWATAGSVQAHSQAQQSQPEDARGLRTREFLGLGRMPDAAKAAEGAKIFASNCSFCHGNDARGASAPDLMRSAVVLDDNQGELIGSTVHNGRPGKGMPAFPSITNEQLVDISEYLHLQVELAANRGTYKTPEHRHRQCPRRGGLLQRRGQMHHLSLSDRRPGAHRREEEPGRPATGPVSYILPPIIERRQR